MNGNRNRSMLMGVVGGYLLYLSYELLKSLIDNVPTDMPRAVSIIAIAFFTIAGIGLLVFAWKLWKKPADEQPVVIGEEENDCNSEQEQEKDKNAATNEEKAQK